MAVKPEVDITRVLKTEKTITGEIDWLDFQVIE